MFRGEPKTVKGRDQDRLGKNKHGKIDKRRNKRGHLHAVKLLSVFFVRLCPVPDHRSVSYLLLKLNNWMFSYVSVLSILCACLYDLLANFKLG